MSGKKIKPIMPSLRESNRYITFEILSSREIKDFDIVEKSFETEFRNFMGDLILSKAGLMILKETWNPNSQRGVIKIEKKYVDHVKSTLCLIKDIDNNEVIVRSLITSGMINRVKKLIIGG